MKKPVKPFIVKQEQLDLKIAPTQDGYMPLTVSTLTGSEAMTIMLRPGGVAYVALESINALIDMKETKTLKILRDTLFALPLTETERENHKCPN